MPHASLKLVPGVNQNRTPALNEAAISSSNLIRFIPDQQGLGLVQKLGGWSKFVPTPFSNKIRSLLAWEDINAIQHLGVGTEDGLFQITNSNQYNISPQTTTANVVVSFSTVAGSSIVVVTDNGSNESSYNSIFIKTHISVGGLILFGFYNCYSLSANTYNIISTDILGNASPATATVNNAGSVAQFSTAINTNPITVVLNNHNFQIGNDFPILIPTTFGGVTLFGNYTVISIINANSFTINSQNIASSTSSIYINGGLVQFDYFIGQGILPTSTGYGIGGYGIGGYGTGTALAVGRTFTTSAASGSGTTATLSFLQNYYVPIGAAISVSGVTPTGFNGSFIVTSSTQGATSTVTYTALSSVSGPQSVAGTITVTSWPANPARDWFLDNWGEILISSPQKGALFEWSPSSGASFSSVISNAPIINEGFFVAMPERQIVAWGSTFNGIQDPLLLRWCDINNFSSWIATVTNQAGSYRIPKGSRIVGAMQGPQQGLVWTDLSVWSMQYINLPYVYSFNEIGTGCGLIGRKAAASMNGVVYWMGPSQFFSLSSNGVEPIICPIWDVVFQELDTTNLEKIRCAPNSRFGEISWFFPTLSSGGEVSNYVKYNFLIGVWDFGTLSRTAWIDQSVLGPPIGSDNNNYIYQHETSTDADTLPMQSSFQTGFFALADGDQKMFLDQVWPDMKFGYYGGSQNANIQITFYVADYPGQTPLAYGPFTITQATHFITPRLRGRLVSIKISSEDSGSFWRIGNIRYRLQPDGRF